jgi:ATP-binding cassette subfamily B multidrug efflux pump
MSEERVEIKPKRQQQHMHGPMGGMGAPVEKPKNFKKSLYRLMSYLRPNLFKLIIVFIFAVASTVFGIFGPKISGYAMTNLFQGIMSKSVVDGLIKSDAASNTAEVKKQTADIQNQMATYAGNIQKDMVQFGATYQQYLAKIGVKAVPSTSGTTGTATTQNTTLTQEEQLAALQQLIATKLPDVPAVTAATTADENQLIQNLTNFKADKDVQSTKLLQLLASVKKQQDTAALLSGVPKMTASLNKDQKAEVWVKLITTIQKLTPAQFTDLNNMMKQSSPKGSTTMDLNSIRTMSKTNFNSMTTAIKETGGNIDFSYIWKISMWLLLLYGFSALCMFVQQFIMSAVAQKTVYQLRKDINDKLATLPLKYFDNHSNGEILSRVTNDIDTISTTLQQSITQIITSIIQILGYIIMMLTISWSLTLIVLVSLPLYILATVTIAKKSQKYFAAQQKQIGELSGHVEEMYTGHKIVKAFGHEQISIDKFTKINDKLYDAGWKAQFISGVMFPLMNFISNLSYVGICVVGGILVTNKALQLGDITAFIQYSRSFTQPIIQTANIANIIQSTIACAERVFEVLDEQEEQQDDINSKVIEMPRGEVKFENVKFGYEDDKILMNDMNIDVKQGATIAIVGPTGAGKTTLVNLLMRFYEIQGGKITVDGIDIKDIKRSALRTMFGMVLQDTWLFNGTIRENIAYGKENATDEDVYAAAKEAHADHFIRTLPEGYDTILNEEASNISQGQKQLLTIARAFLADPAILILDEATSSVDTRTELRIQKAMSVLMKGRTNFVIAHRLSTIRDAELILVMDHGTIIEKGTHKELLEKGDFYADLYNSQFAGPAIEENAV